MPLLYIYLFVLLGSAVTGAAYWKYLKARYLHFFVPLLFAVFALEMYIFYIVRMYNAPTGWLYNLLILVEASVFSYFYLQLSFLQRYRRVIITMITLLLLAAFVTYTTVSPIRVFNTYLFLSGGFVIVLCGVFFLYQYFQLDTAALEKKWLPVVWFTAGILIFYSISSITIALYRSLVSYQVTIFGMKLHQVIPQSLSILRYGCVATAFYLCKKKN